MNNFIRKIKKINFLQNNSRFFMYSKGASEFKNPEEHSFSIENNEKNNSNKRNKSPIDPDNARFPYCIVWTTLPLLSHIIPIIGHTGICKYYFFYCIFHCR